MEFLTTPADRREYYNNIQALRKIRAAFSKNAAVELQSVEHPDNVIIFSRDTYEPETGGKRYRLSWFDAKGAIMHSSRDTIKGIIKELRYNSAAAEYRIAAAM